MILICILPIPLNRLWLCNVLTSHLFGAFVNANAGKRLLSTPFLAQHLCSLSSGQKKFFKKAVHRGKQRGSTLAGPTLSAHFFEYFFYFILFRPVNFKTVHHSHHGLRRWWHSLATHLSLSWSNLIYSASVSSLSSPALCFKTVQNSIFLINMFFFLFLLSDNQMSMKCWFD